MCGISSTGRMSSATSPPGSATPNHHFRFTGANSIRVIIQIDHGTIPGRQQPSQSRTRSHNGFKSRNRLIRLIRPIRLPRSNPRGTTSPPGKLKNSLSVLVAVGQTTHQANVNCVIGNSACFEKSKTRSGRRKIKSTSSVMINTASANSVS